MPAKPPPRTWYPVKTAVARPNYNNIGGQTTKTILHAWTRHTRHRTWPPTMWSRPVFAPARSCAERRLTSVLPRLSSTICCGRPNADGPLSHQAASPAAGATSSARLRRWVARLRRQELLLPLRFSVNRVGRAQKGKVGPANLHGSRWAQRQPRRPVGPYYQLIPIGPPPRSKDDLPSRRRRFVAPPLVRKAAETTE